MIVNIIKKAEEVELIEDSTYYYIDQPVNEGSFTIKPLYGVSPITKGENFKEHKYPIHKIRWIGKIHNYVFQDKILEKMIEDYNTEWEVMNNKIFELQKLNAEYKENNDTLKNMNFFQFLKMKLDKKFKRRCK